MPVGVDCKKSTVKSVYMRSNVLELRYISVLCMVPEEKRILIDSLKLLLKTLTVSISSIFFSLLLPRLLQQNLRGSAN